MVQGRYLTKMERQQIYNYFLDGGSPERCIEIIFLGNNFKIKLKYLQDRWRFFANSSVEQIASYIIGKERQHRTRIFNDITAPVFKLLSTQQPKRSCSERATDVAEIMGGEFPIVSAKTISNELKRSRISEKSITHVSKLVNEDGRAETLRLTAHTQTEDFHNFDESPASLKKFFSRTARSEIGSPCISFDWPQWMTEDRQPISVIADYTPHGWSCWRIFTSTLNHLSVETFLLEELSDFLTEDSVTLYDGASTHLTPTTLRIIDEVTNGRRVKVAAYGHDLSPVERGFANIWCYVRRHWVPGQQTCMDVLEEAFSFYAIGGPHGYKAREHWNLFDRNHSGVI